MPAPTANEIKTQLKSLLTPVIATSGTKKAKIIDYLALAFKPGEGEDPTVLRSDDDTVTLADDSTVQRVNCLMISEEAFTQDPQTKDATRTDTRPRPGRTMTRRFRLTYFYQFGAASENAFSTNVEAIRATIEGSPQLGFAMLGANGIAGPGAFIEGHDDLQAPLMAPDAFGDVIVHVAEMTLAVRLTKAANRQ
jgi:hypothetical protein